MQDYRSKVAVNDEHHDDRSNADNPLLEESDLKAKLAQVQPYPDYGLSNNDPYNLQSPYQYTPPTVDTAPYLKPLPMPTTPNVYENRFENELPYQTQPMWQMPSRSEPNIMPSNPDWIPRWQLGDRDKNN